MIMLTTFKGTLVTVSVNLVILHTTMALPEPANENQQFEETKNGYHII